MGHPVLHQQQQGSTHEDSRFPLDGGLELLGDDAVVGADGDGGEVDVPDGVVGRGDRGERRLRPPLVVDRRDQHAAQHARRAEQNQPQTRLLNLFSSDWFCGGNFVTGIVSDLRGENFLRD